MKSDLFTTRLLISSVPNSFTFGAVLAFLQPGNWLISWLSFSFLFLLSFLLFAISSRWATDLPAVDRQPPTEPALSFKGSPARITFAVLVGAAFALRLFVGTALYLALPINGYDDPDDRAGYVFTDAHRRDDQAWELASSDQSILTAFDRSFHTDQYGGLLAFCALAYRYVSPDAHRPLLLILLSAFIATIGLVFLWKSATTLFGEKVALAACWIYALYPESILLGGAAMREPYLMTFSAMALWGFASWRATTNLQPSTANRPLPITPLGLTWLALDVCYLRPLERATVQRWGLTVDAERRT